MKWHGRRQSTNVDDRRSHSGGSSFSPALLAGLLRFAFTKKGLITLAVVALLLWIFGINPLELAGNLLGGQQTLTGTQASHTPTAHEEELAAFAATVLADTEDVWNQLLTNYREPTLVLFTGSVSSACGSASSATGPFYCPADEKLYLDLSFFSDMERELHAAGDFAQAYVIAHEVGHHIQKLSGTTQRVQAMRSKLSEREYNQLSVRLELQADFLAGVWAHHSQRGSGWLEQGDLQEAINAANAIGDDRLQREATGSVVPDSFTHGTSEQRMRWFKTGFESGDLAQGDTFSATRL